MKISFSSVPYNLCFDSQGATAVVLLSDNGVSVLSMANTPGYSLS